MEQDVETRTTRLAEEILKHEWRFHNNFHASGSMYVENGVLRSTGYIVGNITGSPVGVCGWCGHSPISEHFTLIDKDGMMMNVGNECIYKFIDKPKADLISKAVKSSKTKASSMMREKFYFEQLNAWLQGNADELHEARQKRIAKLLEANPNHYLDLQPRIVKVPKYEFGYVCGHEDVVVEEWRRVRDAEFQKKREITFWAYSKEKMPERHWKTNTMYKVFVEEANKDIPNTVIPKPKLVKSQQEQIRVKAQELSDGMLSRLKALQ